VGAAAAALLLPHPALVALVLHAAPAAKRMHKGGRCRGRGVCVCDCLCLRLRSGALRNADRGCAGRYKDWNF